MSASAATSLRRLPTSDGDVVLVDASCGSCAACVAGDRLWCTAVRDDGATISPALPAAFAADIAEALAAASALASLGPDARALVMGERATVVAALTGRAPGLLVAVDPRDPSVREALAADHSSARAAVVATADDLRAAVRAVRRGGRVCGPLAPTVSPSVTEVVQREVTIVPPVDVVALAGRLSAQDWADAVDAVALVGISA